jgi:hypothetical protein
MIVGYCRQEVFMRIMLQFKIPVEKGNQAAADGSISQAIKDLVNQVQPESAYFYLRDGKRCGMVVFEETDAARLTAINEPLFAKLNAEIDLQPVLVLEDLFKNL